MPFLRTCIFHPLEREPGSLVRSQTGLPIQARTLGEAVEAAAKFFGVHIVPHDPPKWFRIYGIPELSEYKLVDIHVHRGKENICPKQDLLFPLEETDVVGIGVITC
jgi:hypothetical protein